MKTVINKDNFRAQLSKIPVNEFPSDLKELHDFVIEATEDGTRWEAYEDLGIKPVMDHYFVRLNEFIDSKTTVVKPREEKKDTAPEVKKPKKENSENRNVPTKRPAIEEDEEEVEFVEKIPDEIRFIKRYLSLNGKKKTKHDLLLFINALHRAITSLIIRAASPYAEQIRYIQSKIVAKHNSMTKPEVYVIPAKMVEQLKEIVESFKVMPSVNLIKRYINLNGRYGVKEKAQVLVEAMKNALQKGKVAKNDKYNKIYNRMMANLNTYIKNKNQRVLEIEESELNGLNGILNGIDGTDSKAHSSNKSFNEKAPQNVSTRKRMSIDEQKNAHYETIGLGGQYKILLGEACKPTHILAYGEGGSGKSSFILKYAEYLNGLNNKVLFVAGEQYNTPTFKALLNWLNIQGNDDFVIVKDLGEVNPKDFDFIALDSKDSLGIDVKDFRELKKAYPDQSFIISSQGTKTGDFTGSGQWRNEVDTMIYCERGIAKTTEDKNRWGGKGEMEIFDNDTVLSLNGKPKSLATLQDQILYDILSPDGFSIRMPGDPLFKTRQEGTTYFKKWKRRFEAQGYYSSNSGRILLTDLEAECTWAEVPKSDADTWLGYRAR